MSHGPTASVEDRLSVVPFFGGKSLDIEPLLGGLTNVNVRVRVDGRQYVARLSNPSGDLLAIDRVAEYHNSMAAAAIGAAPAVSAWAPEVGVLVIEWAEGRTLTGRDLLDPEMLPRVAEACRRLHSGPRFVNGFDMFAIQRRYLDVVTERGFKVPKGYLDHLPVVAEIQAALAVRPEPSVPCNNDPCFELGNSWSESDLPLELLDDLVAAYYGRTSARLVARARLLGLMSKYGWTLWVSIQDGVSPLDFDLWAWGMEKYERAVAEFTGPDLPRLLLEVATAD